MSQQAWINNFKYDINQISNYVFEINKYLKHLVNTNNNYRVVHYSIIKQFSDSLDSITILLNSNYNEKNDLKTSKINNINGIFILIRKIIEANMMLNIIINNGRGLNESYLNQIKNDESHLSIKFGKSNFDFNNLSNHSNDKYIWISKIMKTKVKSINDLIDLSNTIPHAKANLIAWVKECNYMSHPTLYSDHRLISQFNGEFLFDFHYIFEILIEMMGTFYTIIMKLEEVPEFKSNYDISLIEKVIPQFLIFKNDYNTFSRLLSDDYIKKINHSMSMTPYNIRTELYFINIKLTSIFNNEIFKERKKKTVGKLLDIFAEDIHDLLIGYYEKNDIIFYSKIRQVLEDISHIDKVLKMDESEIELYQCYTDIQRYNNMANTSNILRDFYRELPNYKKIKINNMNITSEQYYYENIDFFKNYIQTEFNKRINTKQIKTPNSWLFDGEKIPSNWQIIKEMIISNNFIENIDINFYNGLYSLSSLFCHVNHFSITNEVIGTDNSYVKYLKGIMILVKGMYDRLLSLTPHDFQKKMNLNMSEIDNLLYKLYNYDIINIPNPS